MKIKWSMVERALEKLRDTFVGNETDWDLSFDEDDRRTILRSLKRDGLVEVQVGTFTDAGGVKPVTCTIGTMDGRVEAGCTVRGGWLTRR